MFRPWKNPRSKFWWFRYDLPKHLHARFGKTSIKFSLETTDSNEAEILCHEHGAKLLRQIQAFEHEETAARLAGIEMVVDRYIDDLAAAFGSLDEAIYLFLVLLFLGEARASADDRQRFYLRKAVGFDLPDMKAKGFGFTNLEPTLVRHRAFESEAPERSAFAPGFALRETAVELLNRCEWQAVEEFVAGAASHAGISIMVGQPAYAKAAEHFLRRLVSHRFQVWPKGLEQAFGSPHVATATNSPPVHSSVAITAAQASEPRTAATADVSGGQAGTHPLTQVHKEWEAKVKPTPKTRNEADRAVRRFVEMFGDLPVEQITKTMMKSYRDKLKALPSRPVHAIRELAIDEQIEQAREKKLPTLSDTSVEKDFGMVRAILGLAVDEFEYIDENPAAGVRVTFEKDHTVKRLPFSGDDLRLIFSDSLMSDATSDENMFWFTFMAPLTGLRPEETAVLRPENIRCEDGIWHIAVETDRAAVRRKQEQDGEHKKRVKTAASFRNVPIHAHLIDAGFIEFAQHRKDAKEEWLFVGLEIDKLENRSTNISKKLNRRLRSLGIKDEELVFYSHRHTLKRALRDDPQVKEEIADLLAGHAPASVGRKYGHGAGLKALHRAVKRLKYLNINWEPVIRAGRARVRAMAAVEEASKRSQKGPVAL